MTSYCYIWLTISIHDVRTSNLLRLKTFWICVYIKFTIAVFIHAEINEMSLHLQPHFALPIPWLKSHTVAKHDFTVHWHKFMQHTFYTMYQIFKLHLICFSILHSTHFFSFNQWCIDLHSYSFIHFMNVWNKPVSRN